MVNIRTKCFHTIDVAKKRTAKTYILETWRPNRDIHIIGAFMGLLCVKEAQGDFELYISITRKKIGRFEPYFVNMKKDFLFYMQRDVYTYCTGPNDLTQTIFLPPGDYFYIKKGQPVYVNVGYGNGCGEDYAYDAFANLYYY